MEPDDEIGEDELVILRIDTDEDGNDAYVTIDDFQEELDDVFEKVPRNRRGGRGLGAHGQTKETRVYA